MAVGPIQDSLRKRPDVPEVLYHLGMTYAKLGDKAKARETLERALKLEPKVGGRRGQANAGACFAIIAVDVAGELDESGKPHSARSVATPGSDMRDCGERRIP